MEAAYGSGLVAALLAVALLAGCAGPADIALSQPATAANDVEAAQPGAADAELVSIKAPPFAAPDASEVAESKVAQLAPVGAFLSCGGPATQGGAILCRTNPGATVSLDGKAVAVAGQDGMAVIGLRRNQPTPAEIGVRITLDGEAADIPVAAFASVEVLKRKDAVSKFEMDCKRIAPQSPEDQRHAERSWVRKDKALKGFHEPLAPVGLVKPADGPYSSAYGVTRTYVPRTKDCEGSTSVHNGQDIAIPTGTEIRAPMAGTVLLGDPDLFYEGGAVFLDMGRGLVSVTMHMSRVDVKDGEAVAQGQVLGLSGATGRVTGPHLHWAIKYRNVLSDDRGTDIWLDPLLMLDLKPPG